jgi:hypothetical protein
VQRKQCRQHRRKAGQCLGANLSAADVFAIRELAVSVYIQLESSRVSPELTADVVREGQANNPYHCGEDCPD